MARLIHHFLDESAQQYPQQDAVWCRNTWVSYGSLAQQAASLARYLHDTGIRRGERVAILFDNSHEYVVCYYAALMCGAVVVSLNTETTSASLQFLLNHAEAAAILVSRKYFRLLLPILAEAPTIRVMVSDAAAPAQHVTQFSGERAVISDILDARLPAYHCPGVIDVDLASIVYTSGSTGEPKGVMLTHLNIVSNTRSIIEYLELTSRDRIMVVLPFHYVYGKTLLNTHVSVGGSVVIDNRFAYPNAVLQTMREQQTTGFAGVPSTFMMLLNRSALRDTPLPSLRYVTQAGGGMAASVQKEVYEVFSPARVFIMYGATEAAPRLTWVQPERLPEKFGSIGIPLPNVRVFVADPEGRPLKVGEQGEIVAQGSNIMQGYWKDPEGTARVLRNGLYFTGDIGTTDDEGYLFVVGRGKDMLKVGGNRVSAKEIEDAILGLDAVLEAAVIGVGDPVLGEAPKAFVVCREEAAADEESLRRTLSGRLPAYKVPKHWEFVQTLPKNSSGKILKQQLMQGTD